MTAAILALDHIVINVNDLAQASDTYAALLGVQPHSTGRPDGQQGSVLRAPNVSVVLQQSPDTEGLAAIGFRVDDLSAMERRLSRLGLSREATPCTDPVSPGARENAACLRLKPAAARGLAVGFVQRERVSPASLAGDITGLDHIVLASGDGNSTGFFLGTQLGLDLRMDLSNADWDARLMFFRCGDLIVEVFQRLSEAADASTDRFYGLSWRVENADAARARLLDAGFEVSEVRKGRKPGTRVLTVRTGTASVPTLLIEPVAR